jgi:hypothetical protein
MAYLCRAFCLGLPTNHPDACEITAMGLFLSGLGLFMLIFSCCVLTDNHLYFQRELTKCMAQDPKVSAQKISAADIDAVFGNATEDHVTTAIEEEQTKEKYHKSAHDKKAELHQV